MPYTYLALGDSYTIGEKVQAADNFPHQAVALLRAAGLPFDEPVIVARTGWTTDELEDGIQKANLQPPYDFVTLLIGVNNQYRGRPVNEYALEFEALLHKALQFAQNNFTRVIVLSIPDWGATPFAEGRDRRQITAAIDTYNAVNKQVADQYNVHYIDITPGTRDAATDRGLVADDGLHPSGQEYARWAGQVAAIIRHEIRKR